MTDFADRAGFTAAGRDKHQELLKLAFLIGYHIVICCVSLVYASRLELAYIFFDPSRWSIGVGVVAAFALVSVVFVFARFSFGYLVGFYFYTAILGFLWLVCFTRLHYDFRLAALSAATSAIAFLLPALLITSPVPQLYAMSRSALEYLLTFILALAVVIIAVGAIYNFRLVALTDIYDFRDDLRFPTIINYLTGIIVSALLPFAFACFVALKQHWRAAAVLLLLLLFYPITLSKVALFAPTWLLALLVLCKIFEARIAVVLSLLLPMLVGVILVVLFKELAIKYYEVVNFRMIIIPSSAMDIYNDFFSRHDLTYFCQIWLLKPIMHCPYQDPLSILMERTYHHGNFNASLFTTEGIASVGLLWAPIAALVCGLVFALSNGLSANLPPRFILMSGAVLPQYFLNVPLTTALLTHGAGLLFLLWYIMPRTMLVRR
jgi:hypothetical protein